MRRLLLVLSIGVFAAVLAVLGHLALIEIGREVATLRTPLPDGTWMQTRLWIVDDRGSAWLHSAGAEWVARFAGDPVVEVERDGGPLKTGPTSTSTSTARRTASAGTSARTTRPASISKPS